MATSAADVSRTLKEVLYETLASILSPVQDVRANAEQQINVLEVTDEFGVHLTELTLDSNALLAIRQLASVLLRQYVESHWSSESEKFRRPETLPEAKAAIRNMLPMGLQESISKLRSSVAYAIAAIAHWDWPEAWPQLFDLLMLNVTSENSFAVHGAMRALTEVSRDVGDTQMPQIAPVMLPQMLKIFTDAEKYSIRTRGRAVEIFVTCAEVIGAMGEYNKSYLKTLLFPVLPQFTEAFVKALLVPDGDSSDSGLKKDVINALKILIRVVPKAMAQWLPHILAPVWTSLTESANLYVKTVVNDIEEANNPVDSDGEVLSFENLVFSIFDFVSGLVESMKFRSYVQNGMADLLYYVVLYMQITEEQIGIWSNDPDRFVADEDDESFSYSVRISALDLLMSLNQEFEDETAASLCTAILRHIQETSKNPTNPHSWKIHESSMLALGSVNSLIIKQLQDNKLQFDILGFLQSVVLEDLNTSTSPFLLGRCLWIAGRYTEAMTEDLIHRFLQATVSGLQPSQPPCVRISAVRAIFGFCDHLTLTSRESLLLPFLPPLMEGLLLLATQFSVEVLSLVLEIICKVLSVNSNFTSSIESRVTPLAISVFLKHNSDPVLVSIAEEIFRELCHNPSCQGPVQQRLLPTLTSILQAPPSKIPLGLQAVAIDVLQTLVRSSTVPLPEPLIAQAFPAAVYCIMHTDDNSILQNGSECLRAFVSVSSEQIASWHDDTGHSGLDYVINVIELILDPKTPESAAAFVGNLISTLVRKVGPNLGEKADQLLRASLSKLQQVESVSIAQNLILVYAQLFRTQMERILDFLSGVPGPTGKSALEFVLVLWCQNHSTYIGEYENKVSAFSLSKILEYTIKTNDKRLQEIEVKGEPVYYPHEGEIRTRSKTAQNPEQWSQIPLLVKIYKILIQELANDFENFDQGEDISSDEDDDIQENNSSDGMSVPQSSQQTVSDYLAYDTVDEREDDPDIIEDPLFKMNLKNYIIEFLQKLSQQPCYASFTSHHTPQEKNLLQTYNQSAISNEMSKLAVEQTENNKLLHALINVQKARLTTEREKLETDKKGLAVQREMLDVLNSKLNVITA